MHRRAEIAFDDQASKIISWVAVLAVAIIVAAALFVGRASAAPVNIVDPTEKTTGALKTYNVNPDRDLDHYETVIATATLDTATSAWSAPIDLRKYSSFTVIVHIVPAAADSVNTVTYNFGLTMYAPPVLAIDWTGYGMPPVTRGSGGRLTQFFSSGLPDSTAGYWYAGGMNSIASIPGERVIQFRATAPLASALKNYVNRAYTTTVRIPGSDLLGPGDRPRFAVFQLRGMSKSAGATAPSIRVDVEALR